MKTIKLEQPDSSIHMVQVESLGYLSDKDKYLMTYLDLNTNNEMYTILEKEGEKYIKNPFLEGINIDKYEPRDIEILPSEISCKKKKQAAAAFIVYRDINSGRLFIQEEICASFGIGRGKELIEEVSCREVTKEEISYIENITKDKNPCLKAVYKEIVLTNAYTTIINNPNNPINPYNIDNKKINTVPEEFEYYYDLTTNRRYINRDIYDHTKLLSIPIEGIPLIIEGKNCYSITKKQLKEYEEKVGKKGKEIVVDTKKDNKYTIIYVDKTNNKYYIPIKQKALYNDSVVEIAGTPCKEISEEEISNINNKVIYVSVYMKSSDELRVTLSTIDNNIYIPENIANEYDIPTKKKIRVDGEIYIQTNEYELLEMKKKVELTNRKLTLIEKRIIPKKNPELKDMFDDNHETNNIEKKQYR